MADAQTSEWPSSSEWPRLGMPTRISTGCNEIDDVLGDGFKVGVVTEVCGESGIGKTHLCMQAILANWHICTERGIPTMSIWITAKCVFPARRYHKICRKYYDDGDNIAMEELQILNADTGSELSDVLTQIRSLLEVLLEMPKKTRVIVIYSISALFSYPSRTVVELEEHTNMVTSIGFVLKRLAEKYGVAILVCNWVVNSYDQTNPNNFKTSGRTVKPVVGKAWDKKHAARVVLSWEMDETDSIWQKKLLSS